MAQQINISAIPSSLLYKINLNTLFFQKIILNHILQKIISNGWLVKNRKTNNDLKFSALLCAPIIKSDFVMLFTKESAELKTRNTVLNDCITIIYSFLQILL